MYHHSSLVAINKSSGFTLLQVLGLIGLLSMLALIYGYSQPVIKEERMAALTIARTQAIIEYAASENFGPGFGWEDGCDPTSPDPEDQDAVINGAFTRADAVNGFGYQYKVASGGCTSRIFTVYQYVPERWASYIINHLEATAVVDAVAGNLATRFDDFDQSTTNGLVLLSTKLDVYNNLVSGGYYIDPETLFVEFDDGTPNRNSVNNTRKAQVSVDKPECAGKIPTISYQVTGACSHFPLNNDPYDVQDYIEDKGLDYKHFYGTSSYVTTVTNDCDDPDPSICDRDTPWVISISSKERWWYENTVTNPDGSSTSVEVISAPQDSASDIICANPGATTSTNVENIKQLMKFLGIKWTHDFLHEIGLSHGLWGAGGYINGTFYWNSEIRGMEISTFNDEFSFDLEDVLGSDFPASTSEMQIKLQAWVGCR